MGPQCFSERLNAKQMMFVPAELRYVGGAPARRTTVPGDSWLQCDDPSCGKWRAILRIMDAKGNVIEGCHNGEWYCVMNTWDEKMASCCAQARRNSLGAIRSNCGALCRGRH